ncbi:YxeA family protein [Alkalicoccobacillus murimartini]|uniref:Uncharacterized protein (TIGR01655 family) n=1 Tax=Alkalicoccobacillus murimartini TaxID=171685 RepID=A0ABT9YHC3_9BACI|nr:YxeA family protein [Alkalicoccobacillus murimartini]MDQ0207259.1 uncharacterized protein (TIGR01655 family) [Alkalicoccobacillus murimartini]
MIKKIGLTIILVIAAVVAGFMIYSSFQNEDYYVKIVDEGVPVENAPAEATQHDYETLGVTEDGESEIIEFMGMRQLRQGAYLIVTMKGDQAVTYSEVEESEVPADVKSELDNQ